jgi:hypothetical protein
MMLFLHVISGASTSLPALTPTGGGGEGGGGPPSDFKWRKAEGDVALGPHYWMVPGSVRDGGGGYASATVTADAYCNGPQQVGRSSS